ncbi:MAG: carbohydrate-binding protein [bacterium]|nr:carbohydrate-binding protein [bacterium]
MRRSIALTILLVCAATAGAAVYTTYHWHQQQPIYWPQPSALHPTTVETAWESIQRRNAGAAHPQNDVAQIFSVADRVAAYQWRMRDAIAAMSGPLSGAQVSYAGCLIDNVASLGAAGALGYSPAWNQPIRQARGWTTPGGFPRLDQVLTPYHHSIAPLLDEEALRMEIRIAKLAHERAWGAAPGLSQGFFPPEMCFSTRIIPVLAAEGIQWSFVPNNHLSRACADFPLVLGTGGENCDPPNRADQLNPPQAHWWSRTISRDCTPTNAVPFAMRPHQAQHIDPASGAVSTLTVVPMEMAMSWQDGYQMYGLEDVAQVAPHSEPEQPLLIVLGHDGDNAWGGGYSYYMQSVPGFTAAAVAAGHTPTVVQQYLADHPVSPQDIVHVEDGGWVNADGDFGSPDFINWNWPPVGADGRFDMAGGWAEDIRNWAVITAAQNLVSTAAQIDGDVDPAAVMDPAAHPASSAELAWHHFLPALESGYMYYGAALDMEVKATVACNTAVAHAAQVIGDGALDQTPPTIWLPQQHPHNPGAVGFGSLWGYQQTLHSRDFWVWTFVHDVSGVDSVTFHYRIDADGENPLASHQNETYAGGPEVGSWRQLPMHQRAFPAGNVHNDPNIDFFVMPTVIADQYWLHVTEPELVEEGGLLVDYFVEARDSRGHVRRSPILHTWIGTGQGQGGGGEGGRVSWWPRPGQAGQAFTIQYRVEGGPLPPATDPIWLHYGFNNWGGVSDAPMAWAADSAAWRITLTLPVGAQQVDFVFHDNLGHWDNNSGQDWHVPVEGAAADWAMDGQLDAAAQLVAQAENLQLWAGWNGSRLYLAGTPAQAGRDHFLFLAAPPGAPQPAPWAKAGQAAAWGAYLANEVDNGWSGWFDTGAGAPAQARGAVLEGSLDPAALFGALPDTVWLALGAWTTPNGGVLQLQAPPTLDGDGHLQAGEWVAFPLASPTFSPVELQITRLADGTMRLEWVAPAPPAGWLCTGVRLEASSDGQGWQHLVLTPDTWWTDPAAPTLARRFYRARAVYARP